MLASQINHYQKNKEAEKKALLKRLKKLGFNCEVLSFGITVMIGGKIVFHGRIDAINKWLKEIAE